VEPSTVAGLGGVVAAIFTFLGVWLTVRASRESNQRTAEWNNIQTQLKARDDQRDAWREDAIKLRERVNEDNERHERAMVEHKKECTAEIDRLEGRVEALLNSMERNAELWRRERMSLIHRVDSLALWARRVKPILDQHQIPCPPLPPEVEESVIRGRSE
jgi:Spy/CpxP family protein refolding chaperone